MNESITLSFELKHEFFFGSYAVFVRKNLDKKNYCAILYVKNNQNFELLMNHFIDNIVQLEHKGNPEFT